MVGFTSSLRMSRRRGWESAYLNYESLKLLLTQIEAAYEEGALAYNTISSSSSPVIIGRRRRRSRRRRRNNNNNNNRKRFGGSSGGISAFSGEFGLLGEEGEYDDDDDDDEAFRGGGGGGGGEDSVVGGDEEDEMKERDYRDDLFLESDSDLAFAFSDEYDDEFDDDDDDEYDAYDDDFYEEEEEECSYTSYNEQEVNKEEGGDHFDDDDDKGDEEYSFYSGNNDYKDVEHGYKKSSFQSNQPPPPPPSHEKNTNKKNITTTTTTFSPTATTMNVSTRGSVLPPNAKFAFSSSYSYSNEDYNNNNNYDYNQNHGGGGGGKRSSYTSNTEEGDFYYYNQNNNKSQQQQQQQQQFSPRTYYKKQQQKQNNNNNDNSSSTFFHGDAKNSLVMKHDGEYGNESRYFQHGDFQMQMQSSSCDSVGGAGAGAGAGGIFEHGWQPPPPASTPQQQQQEQHSATTPISSNHTQDNNNNNTPPSTTEGYFDFSAHTTPATNEQQQQQHLKTSIDDDDTNNNNNRRIDFPTDSERTSFTNSFWSMFWIRRCGNDNNNKNNNNNNSHDDHYQTEKALLLQQQQQKQKQQSSLSLSPYQESIGIQFGQTLDTIKQQQQQQQHQPLFTSFSSSKTINTKLLPPPKKKTTSRCFTNNHNQPKKRRQKKKKKKKKKKAKVPPYLKHAHSKARDITQRFLGLLNAEVEKVALFAHSRLGELADTVGSLRFPSDDGYGYGDDDYYYGEMMMEGSSSSHHRNNFGVLDVFGRGGGGGGGSTVDDHRLYGGAGGTGGGRSGGNTNRGGGNPLSDGGMHPSASSSDDEYYRAATGAAGAGGNSSNFWSSGSSEEGRRGNKKESSSTTTTGGGGGKSSSGAISCNSASTASTPKRRTTRNTTRRNNNRNHRNRNHNRYGDDITEEEEEDENKKKTATRRQIRHNEHLRLARPMFQRSDNVVGEDFLLLSAVDEADAYVMVAVELMHLLRFICVNVIAVRKICKKHDRLLANRMLGGYYHWQRREEMRRRRRRRSALFRRNRHGGGGVRVRERQRQTTRRKSHRGGGSSSNRRVHHHQHHPHHHHGRGGQRRGANRKHNISSSPPMLGRILALSMSDKDGSSSAAINASPQYSPNNNTPYSYSSSSSSSFFVNSRGGGAVGGGDRLLGVHDARIQRLANSSTVQMVSSSLALALSEYEISHSRADALLSRPTTTTTTTNTAASVNVSYSSSSFLPKKRDSAFVERNNHREKIDNRTASYSSSSYKFSPLPRGIGSAFGLSSHRLRQAMANRMTGDCMDVDRDDDYSVEDDVMYANNDDSNDDDDDDDDDGGPPSTSSSISLTRLRFAVASVFGLREAARTKTDLFYNYLSRSLVVFTGPHVVGDGMDGCSRETLDFLVSYEPDAALLLDSHILFNCLHNSRQQVEGYGGVVGRGSIGSVMVSTLAIAASSGNMLLPSGRINRGGDRRRAQEDGMVDTTTAALSIMPNADRKLSSLQAGQQHSTESSILSDETILSRGTILLNLSSILLFTTNYYIICPTARTYARLFGAKSAHSAALIGVTNLSAIVAAIVQRYMVLKKRADTTPLANPSFFCMPMLLLSAVFSLLGNILYSYAFQQSSIWIAICGRFLIGFGFSEVLSRHLFASYISPIRIVPETARFVQASMVGFFLGPLLGTLFDLGDSELVVFGRSISTLTLPGHIMSVCWLLQILGLLYYFKEPENARESESFENNADHLDHIDINSDTTSEFAGDPQETDRLLFIASSDITKPHDLKAAYGSHSSMVVDSLSGDDNSPKKKKSRVSARILAKSINRVRKLIFHNIALPVTLAVFAFVNLTLEVLFSSCAIITHRYFRWSPFLTGLFLTALAASVLPINFLLAYGSVNDRKLMKITLALIGFGLLIMVNIEALVKLVHDIRRIFSKDASIDDDQAAYYTWSFGVVQYVIGMCIVFVSCVVLKGATLSLMSKVAPAKLNKAIADCGFIVTIIMLLGRFIGDILILLVGLSHRIINTDMVNSLSFCLVCVCCAGVYIIKKHYFFLNPL